MKPKVIKNETEYQAALNYIENLMDAPAGSGQEEELELFSMLIENYEKEQYPIGLPDPIEAIKFRMEQLGLERKDLISYMGSQSKVSEVLNQKKPLSLTMIRALHTGLGIPADVLLQKSVKNLPEKHYDLRDFPFSEMVKRGYFKSFNGSLQDARIYAEELLEALFSVWGEDKPEPVYCRNSAANHPLNTWALSAWQARVLELATERVLPPYDSQRINPKLFREIVHLSRFNGGPSLACELLENKGIPVVFLPHLPHTYLDGACFNMPSNRPVIGLTLRHDRLDNFWFTLLH